MPQTYFCFGNMPEPGDSPNNLLRLGLLCHVVDRETEAQRGQVILPRTVWVVRGRPGLEPGQVGCGAHCSTYSPEMSH